MERSQGLRDAVYHCAFDEAEFSVLVHHKSWLKMETRINSRGLIGMIDCRNKGSDFS